MGLHFVGGAGVHSYEAVVSLPCVPSTIQEPTFLIGTRWVPPSLNLASITWLHSRDPQTCLMVRVCFPSVSDSGNKNWRQSDSARHFAKAAKHRCRTRAHQVKLLKLKEQ